MEKHRRHSSAVPPTQNGSPAAQKMRKVSYAGSSNSTKYEYNVVPRSIVNLKEDEEEEEDPQKVRRRLGIPFEEDFVQKKSKRERLGLWCGVLMVLGRGEGVIQRLKAG